MRGLLKLSLTAFSLLAFIQVIQAQPLPPASTPIDGGLISLLLLAGGGALAAKKIRERRKSQE